MTSLVEAYVKPYFIPEIGEEGLTSVDIAQCLGTTHRAVKEKMRKCDIVLWNSDRFIFTAIFVKKGGRGRPKVMYALNTRASYAFSACYQNKKGFSLMSFLVDCGIAVPEMAKEIAKIRHENEELKNEIGKIHKSSKKSQKLLSKVSTK